MRSRTPRTYHSKYQWVICFCATLLTFSVTGLASSAFSVWLPYIRQAHQFTATEVNLIVSCRTLAQIVGLLTVSGYFRRFRLRLGSALTAAGIGLGFILFGFAQSALSYYAVAVGFGFFCAWALTATGLAIGEWFTENKATALGICATGTGIATIVSPAVIAALIRRFSLRTAFIFEGLFVLLVAGVVFLLFHENPAAASNAPQPTQSRQTGPLYALDKRSVLLLTGGVFVIGIAAFGIPSGLPQLFRDYYDENTSSVLSAAFGVSLLAGKLLCGRLTDRLGLLRANYIFFICLVVGGIGSFFAKQSLPLNVISLTLQGVGLSLSTVSVPVYASEFCSPGRYLDALKHLNLAQTIGGLMITYVTGLLADATGNNSTLFLLVAVLTIFSAVMVQAVCRPKEK